MHMHVAMAVYFIAIGEEGKSSLGTEVKRCSELRKLSLQNHLVSSG